jgi:hypothetical protein
LEIIDGEKFLNFERTIDEKGCAKLAIQCGLNKGTEAIIQVWGIRQE